jgi:hypothetical protein
VAFANDGLIDRADAGASADVEGRAGEEIEYLLVHDLEG